MHRFSEIDTLKCTRNTTMIREVSVQSFLDALAGPSTMPGGGSTAAIMGAMAAGLISKVCSLTIGKRGYAEVEDQMKTVLHQAHAVRQRLTSMIEDDMSAYAKVLRAYALARATDAERALRSEAIEEALAEATLAPLACARACGEVMDLSRIVAEKGNLNAAGEAGVAALAAHAALRGAALNVYINTGSMRNGSFVNSKLAELEDILRGRDALNASVSELVKNRSSDGR
jgi:formiminotetrahydrofolate cyclodeaminase